MSRIDWTKIKFDYQECIDYIHSSSPESEVFVGCDSHKKWNPITKSLDYCYVTVVVVHNMEGTIGRGCKLFKYFHKAADDGNMKERLMNEVYYAGVVSMAISEAVGKRPFSIHLDVNPNPNEKSYAVIQEAIGYVRALGLEAVVKPDSVAANAAADRFAVKAK